MVHTTDNAGMTPLHWAAVKGSKPCIRHLVEAGADLFIKEGQGKTPRDVAEELKGLVPYSRGLDEAGYSVDGVRAIPRLSQVSFSMCTSEAMTWSSVIQSWRSSSSPRPYFSAYSIPSTIYPFTPVHHWPSQNS